MTIDVKHTYAYPIETVFDAFLNPEAIKHFMFRTDTGRLVKSSLEPELGGAMVIVEDRNGQMAEHYCSFVEIDRPEKISFVFSVEKDSAESTYVELFFTKNALGSQVQLKHDLAVEYMEYKERTILGWTGILEKLDKYLQKQNAPSRTVAPTKDSQGQILSEGDSVKTIKDLKVKGSSMVVKRGTVVKNIRLIADNPEEIDCKVDGVGLHLETQWLLKM